jgi:hypothetical protein
MEEPVLRPPVLVVARFARALFLHLRELTPVRICMAVRAFLKILYCKILLYFPSGPPDRQVALLAANARMAPPQGKLCRSVIEILRRPNLPTPGRMAALARLLEPPPVRVRVTRGAPFKLDPGILHCPDVVRHQPVAPAAIHLHMFSCQPVSCSVVDELRRRLPPFRSVTGLALLRQLSLVLVGVAPTAIGREAHVRARIEETLIRPHIFRRDMVLRVAPDALEGSVLPLQHVPGLSVVKFLLVETDECEPAPVVLVVAFHTLLPRQLRVEPLPRRHARTELRMTFEALVIRDLFPEGVALRAIPHPFKGGMGGGQIAGRDLGSCRHTQCQEESGEQAGGRYGMP